MLTAALCVLAACDDPIDPIEEKLVGDWHCTATSADAEIYVTFTAEKTFTLYQLVGEGSYRVYNGTWSLTETTLSGKYNDGTDWGSSYEITSESNDSITLTAGDVIETYDRLSEGIPEEVTSNCVTVVKSSGAAVIPFL